jgi:hypothetical protein
MSKNSSKQTYETLKNWLVFMKIKPIFKPKANK